MRRASLRSFVGCTNLKNVDREVGDETHRARRQHEGDVRPARGLGGGLRAAARAADGAALSADRGEMTRARGRGVAEDWGVWPMTTRNRREMDCANAQSRSSSRVSAAPGGVRGSAKRRVDACASPTGVAAARARRRDAR